MTYELDPRPSPQRVHSAVVHCDETSWSINSVWAFLNDKLTVMFYGVHKDRETLEQILDKNAFAGTLVSDNAAVYQGFTSSQKCWAHLLRKAIKLTLEDPENSEYRQLDDRLLLIYRDAKKAAADQCEQDSTNSSEAISPDCIAITPKSRFRSVSIAILAPAN